MWPKEIVELSGLVELPVVELIDADYIFEPLFLSSK